MSSENVSPGTASSRPTRKHGCFYYGCILSILAVVLTIGSCVALVAYGGSEMAPVCEHFLTQVEEDKLAEAYASLGDTWKQSQSQDDFVAYMTQTRKALGPLVRKQRTSTGVFTRNGTTTGQIVYEARFQKDEAKLTFGMEKIAGKWIIQSLGIDAQALRDIMTCPACGAKLKSFSKYCPHCGKPMAPALGTTSSAAVTTQVLEGSGDQL